MYIHRSLGLSKERKSVFLFGPRQTGKSTLLRNTLPSVRRINLLQTDEYLKYSQAPSLLRKELGGSEKVLIVDEVQKIPMLLDEIQYLIDERGMRFILTGSSARKLKRGGVNLLGGRTRSFNLHPFTYKELGGRFDLMQALSYGTLPSIVLSDMPKRDLRAYCGDYLQHEVVAEGLTRNIPAFSRFLESAALLNGQMINYQTMSDQASVPKSTVIEYFKILKDTLIAFEAVPWTRSIKRKPIKTPKYFFFDIGVARSLQKRDRVKLSSPDLGDAFEAWIAHELKSYIDYFHPGEDLNYWRSTSQFEVDFILLDKIAIEVKAKTKLGRDDFNGLRALREEKKLKSYVVVSLVERPYLEDGILVLPWKDFLERLYGGDSFLKV